MPKLLYLLRSYLLHLLHLLATVELDLLFLNNILPAVVKFETFFQKKMPLIHIPVLHSELMELYKEILAKFVRTDHIASSKSVVNVKFDIHYL